MDKMNKEKEKSIGKKIKDLIKGNVKMYLCWLFLLGLGMLIISGIFEARYEKTVQSKIYQAYDEEENLQQDIDTYEKELEELEIQYVQDISAKPCIILCFDDLGSSVYGDVINEMDKYGFAGVIIFRDGKVPGEKGCISVELYQELLGKGWEGAIGNSKEISVYENFPDTMRQKWVAYMKEMQAGFTKNGLDSPKIYIPHEKEKIEEIQDLLLEYQMTGYTVLEEDVTRAAVDMNIDDVTVMGCIIAKYNYDSLSQDVSYLLPKAKSMAVLFKKVEPGAPGNKKNTSLYMLKKHLARLDILSGYVNICTFTGYRQYQDELVNQNLEVYQNYLNKRNQIQNKIISANKTIMNNFNVIFN